MPKNIIMCCDGTNNYSGSSTNVWRLCDSFKVIEGKQIKLYAQGVGTGSTVDKIFGLPFGYGVARSIRGF